MPIIYRSVFMLYLLTAIILLSSPDARAQLNPDNLTQYTEAHGVPGSQVGSVLADQFGYIWLGTINGLARYDGYEFKRYLSDPNDSASVEGLVVWAMFEDSSGEIWVSSSPEKLNMYNPADKTFRRYPYKHLVEQPANVEIGIRAFAEDNKGRIYFGVDANYGMEIEGGLLYLDKGDRAIKKFEIPGQPELHNVYRLTKDNLGNIWLLSFSGIYKIDSERKLQKILVLEKLLGNNEEYPSDILFKKDGHAWLISTKGNLYDYNPADSATIIYPIGKELEDYPNNLTLDKDENIWLSIQSQLAFFNNTDQTFEFLNSGLSGSLANDNIKDLTFDSFGTLWIGTEREGLFKYEERAVFNSYSADEKNSDRTITPGWANNILETQDNKIWITTGGSGQKSGINVLDLKTNTIRPIPFHTFQPEGFEVFAIAEAGPDQLLFGTQAGLYAYSITPNSAKKIELPGVDNDQFIQQIKKDSKGNQWICSFNGLYKKQKNSEKHTHYDLSKLPGSDASSNEITRAYESKNHGLWLTTNNGLFLYDYETDAIERHGYDKKVGDVFISQDINSFCEQNDTTLWVGTWQGGLSRYNPKTKKIKIYTYNDGLPSMSIQGILYDEENQFLWLSTFEGLSRLNLEIDQFNNFSISDGIQGQQFADGSNLKTSDGYFIFGGSNGITAFKPEDIIKNSAPPKVFLTDLKLFNKSIVPGEKSILKKPIYETEAIELAYDQNNISIEFAALHYANPSKNKFSYRLENYDNEWREGSNQQDAFYPNLPPGTYLFQVKAGNNNGVWNEEGASLKIIVHPPWWLTPWAYAAYVLIFISGVFAADRFFRNRIIQRERNRSRDRELAQAKEIEKAYYDLEKTHETLKSTQSQLIQSEKMASLGELTAGIAHEIQNPLNFVNNFSEVSKELIEELLAESSKVIAERDKALEVELLDDVIKNLEKIHHHGQRASGIVKGMLEHSRTGDGKKEPTDINALADEYLRLAYHGLRAKDKSFNAEFKTDFDEKLPKIQVIPQDIGRVLLNLINNAFFAVSSKLKAESESSSDYKPEVIVSTKLSPFGGGKGEDKVEIRVSDNGSGIPENIKDKIFQPFFTTKPTGSGTGLGLSLSYDIVKAHGGELRVETKLDEGSTFIIQISIV